MHPPKTTLAQWRALQAVVDEGGFAAAAEVLGRSQSSVSYAVSRLEEVLGVKLLRLSGRRAVITEAGETLLRGARHVLAEAMEIESLAAMLESGWKAEVCLAVDGILPPTALLEALQAFSEDAPGIRLRLEEGILSGAGEAVMEGRADLAVAPEIPTGFLGEPLLEVEFVPVCHPDHPLVQEKQPISEERLAREVQVVISDSARRQNRDSGWLGSRRRWTVSSLEMAERLIRRGIGFAWLPRHQIAPHTGAGALYPLTIRGGGGKQAHLSLVFARGHRAGPAVELLAKRLREAVNSLGPGGL